MAITPYLYYEDLGATLKWLAKTFGFKRYGTQMKGPDGRVNHAAMKFGAGIVMMGRPDPKQKYRNPRRLGQATQSLYVIVDDVDRHFERAKKMGARILEEPENTEYGHRRYRACDPEGHEWCFAKEIRTRRRRRAGRRSKSGSRAPR